MQPQMEVVLRMWLKSLFQHFSFELQHGKGDKDDFQVLIWRQQTSNMMSERESVCVVWGGGSPKRAAGEDPSSGEPRSRCRFLMQGQ